MQQEFLENSESVTHSDQHSTDPSTQHGLLHRDPSGLHRARSGESAGTSPRSVSAIRRDSVEGVDADQLDEKLRGLSLDKPSDTRVLIPGQRISDYENALTPPTPRQALGFKVIKRSDGRCDGMQLTDFPNGQYRSFNSSGKLLTLNLQRS